MVRVLAAALDSPPARCQHLSMDVGVPRRARGWAGFLLAVCASLVVGGLLRGLSETIHWLWPVRP